MNVPAIQQMSSPELCLRLRQQELVAEFGRFALGKYDFQAILDKASELAALGLDTKMAKVLEYLVGDMAFLVRSGVGWMDGVVGHARIGGDLQSPAGYAFRTGKPVISNHLTGEQRFRTPSLLEEHGVRSAINVLICANDAEPFGLLEGDSTHRGEFGDHDVAFLQALANTIAVAVESQKRQDAREQLLLEKEALLLEKEALLRENQALLAEKDLMMLEVHHRVMNSLHLLGNILAMQARTLTSAEAREQVGEAAGRVATIGAVHRRLHQGGSVVAGDAAAYLRALLADMEGVMPGEANGRAIALKMEPFTLPAADLPTLGLITGELITNAVKHGLGKITVEISQQSAGMEIAVSDEGPGFPHDYDPIKSKGLGMRLVTALAKGGVGALRIDRSVPFSRVIVKAAWGGKEK